jgi:hypothetical protein
MAGTTGLEPAASAGTALRERFCNSVEVTRGLPNAASRTRLLKLWVGLWVENRVAALGQVGPEVYFALLKSLPLKPKVPLCEVRAEYT